MIKKYYSKEGSSLFPYLSIKSNKMNQSNASLFTYSREAIYQMMKINHISQEDTILMPSYQCNIVIDYILPFTQKIVFYNIDKNLNFNKNEIESKITEHTKMIFFVHYFGIITDIEYSLIDILKEKNIKIVHDLAHSFLSLYQRNFLLDTYSDYIISSIYKNIPIGTGAIGIGDFQQNNSMNTKEFFVINLKKILTNFRCFIGKRTFTYYSLHDKSSTQENVVYYKSNFSFTAILYKKLLEHINIDKIIEDKKLISQKYFTLFENNQDFSNIIDKDVLKNNILQAYPIKCENKENREKLFDFLKEDCIDIYPWPSYHPLNNFDTLKDKILLLPLDEYSLTKSKYFLKDNYE